MQSPARRTTRYRMDLSARRKPVEPALAARRPLTFPSPACVRETVFKRFNTATSPRGRDEQPGFALDELTLLAGYAGGKPE